MRARLAGVVVALGVATLALVAPSAHAAEECRGLQVCLPVPGAWVVIPPPAKGQSTSTAVWELRCPLRGYIVAGTDALVSDPAIDVSFRAETGSPVGPGVTTSEKVVFTAVYTGTAKRPTTFQPHLGCVPTSGGGGRVPTSNAQQPPAAAAPQESPLERRVARSRFTAGQTRNATARCRGNERLVGFSHAYGFHSELAPGRSILGKAQAKSVVRGSRVIVNGTARATLPGDLQVEIQAHALCAKGGK
jgi:hypothetical protein